MISDNISCSLGAFYAVNSVLYSAFKYSSEAVGWVNWCGHFYTMSDYRINFCFTLNYLFLSEYKPVFHFATFWILLIGPNLSTYRRMLSHRSVNFSCPLTMPHSRSQITQDKWHLNFGTIARPLQHLCFRSRCIWWDLNGASSATCDFTSC